MSENDIRYSRHPVRNFIIGVSAGVVGGCLLMGPALSKAIKQFNAPRTRRVIITIPLKSDNKPRTPDLSPEPQRPVAMPNITGEVIPICITARSCRPDVK